MELRQYWRLATIAGSLVVAQSLCAQNQSGVTVDVNGQAVNFPSTQPQVIGDRVMIPLRGVLEQLGANVTWNQASQTVTATNGATTVMLQIGDRHARVNGQRVPIDQPAVLMDDTTLVPLRFLSQTFGANVQWDNASQTVNINMATAEAVNTQTVQTTENLSNETSMALKFGDDLQGWTANKPVHFVLDGQPGGQAVIVMPGLGQDVPMQETSPGHYETTWTPDTSVPTSIDEGSAVGKLTLNGKNYFSTPVQNIDVDTMPPMINVNSPQPNAVITGFQPQIDVALSDAGSGVDPAAVSLKVNQQDVTGDAKITRNHLLYDFPNSTPGQYNVALTVADKAGNTTTKNWMFSMTGTSFNSEFVHTGRDSLMPGGQVHFSLKAPPGSQVTVFFGHGRQLNLAESQPGIFDGNYEIRRIDRFTGEPVTASITPPNGQAYTIEAPQAMGISANLSPAEMTPVISSPLASQVITDPLVVAGTAPPTSTVYIHVFYESSLDSHRSIHGDLADITVVADSAGNWQSPPIHIRKWQENSDVAYRIRATTVLPDGTESAATEMRVHQAP
jgi:hypothetical protein